MVKRFTYCLRMLVLLVLTCNVSGAFAASKTYSVTTTSLSSSWWTYDTVHVTGNVSITSNYEIPENKTLIITGNVDLPGKYLYVYGNLLVEGHLNITLGGVLTIGQNGVVFIKKNLLGTTGKISISAKNANTFGTFMCDTLKMSSLKVVYEKHENQLEGEAVAIDEITGSISIKGNNTEGTTARVKGMKLFEAAAKAGLLPIELTSFTATATENGYTFNWVTASENENDYFTLEYSINGVDFSEIDYVNGAGTTSETSEYEYRWDEAPEFDMVYFRLKQTDYNGEYTYSDVIVSCRKKSAGAIRTFRYGPLNLQVVDGELRYIENK